MADPFADAVAEQLPAVDEASPRARRLAAGLALVRQGNDYRTAAARVGVPKSTLWAHVHGVRPRSGRNESLSEIEEHIEDLAAELTARAAERLLERIEDGSMRPSEEIKAMQVARDTLAIRRDWNKATIGDARAVNALADALEAMRDRAQSDATIAQAIPVEAEPSE